MAYLHGYDKIETDRLKSQASLLDSMIYTGLDFSSYSNILEIGCGTGQQSQIILNKFANVSLTSIDIEENQIIEAKKSINKFDHIKNRVSFQTGDIRSLKIANDSFDAVFVCWVLEHVSDPLEILTEALRVLKPNGVIYTTEVYNSALRITPHPPGIMKFWTAFNKLQSKLGGDPDVGMKVGNYMAKAGFKNVKTTPLLQLHDLRSVPKKLAFLDYWRDLMLSGVDNLLEHKEIDQGLVQHVKSEFESLKNNPDSIFFYTPMRTIASK